jgi:subtilisin family serine protease
MRRFVPPALRSARILLSGVLLIVMAAVFLQPATAGRSLVPPGDTGNGTPADPLVPVLIRATRPYDGLVSRIAAAGGTVTHAYRIVDAVAARVPLSALGAVALYAGPHSVSKDVRLTAPDPIDETRGRVMPFAAQPDAGSIAFEDAGAIGDPTALAAMAGVHPDAYLINAGILGVATLHARGITGEGQVVAVIDTGLRPGYPHLTSDGSILGGEDFVGDGLSWQTFLNDGHGTFVAGMISGNLLASFPVTSSFLRAVRRYAPGAVVGTNVVPMVGSAPSSKIFVMRVIGPLTGGDTSVILAAMDEVLNLKDAWRHGELGGVNIGVVNLSLSGVSLNPGRDLLDSAADRLVEGDVVVVDSAGNAGPSGITVGSPGSSYGSLTVGAASLPHNERIALDLAYGPGNGGLIRPFDGPMTAFFSSRGPDADGRADPDVTASGVGSYGMGLSSPGFINLASGTSFSSPTVAGVAALLRQAYPDATARQIRNAIVLSADPNLLADGSGPEDRGAGYVNGQAAFDRLAAGAVPDVLPAPPHTVTTVAANITMNAGAVVDSGPVTRRVGPLLPGQRSEFFYQVPPNIGKVNVTVTPIPPSDPGPVNALFGDDILLSVHSAKTGRHRTPDGEGDYLLSALATGSAPVPFAITALEPGVLRVTISGDWTNAGLMSADVTIASVQAPLPGLTAQGRIREFETIEYPVEVPAGAQEMEFFLSWRDDWSNVPLNDLDLVVVNPNGHVYFDAATFASPEQMAILDPTPGTWRVQVNGFAMPAGEDRYKLRVTVDGRVAR